MADYEAVLRRTLSGMVDPSADARTKVYDRARATIERQIAAMPKRPPDSVIQRQYEKLDAATLAKLVARGDADLEAKYRAAFESSSFDAMMNYYRANYPKAGSPTPEASASIAPATAVAWPKIQCPVLVLHGMQDRALHADGHSGTWNWVANETTIVMFPEAGHFVQHDAPEQVNEILLETLAR